MNPNRARVTTAAAHVPVNPNGARLTARTAFQPELIPSGMPAANARAQKRPAVNIIKMVINMHATRGIAYYATSKCAEVQ